MKGGRYSPEPGLTRCAVCCHHCPDRYHHPHHRVHRVLLLQEEVPPRPTLPTPSLGGGGGHTAHTRRVRANLPRVSATGANARLAAAQPPRAVRAAAQMRDELLALAGRPLSSCSRPRLLKPQRSSSAYVACPGAGAQILLLPPVRKEFASSWGGSCCIWCSSGHWMMSSLRVKCSRGISHLLAAAQPSLHVPTKTQRPSAPGLAWHCGRVVTKLLFKLNAPSPSACSVPGSPRRQAT